MLNEKNILLFLDLWDKTTVLGKVGDYLNVTILSYRLAYIKNSTDVFRNVFIFFTV